MADNIYHPGEQHVQALAGTTVRASQTGKLIANSIVRGAWEFLAAQRMVITGSLEGSRQVWPSILLGDTGFVSTSNGYQVHTDLKRTYVQSADPLWHNLRNNGKIALLAIDLATRRRLRVNGHITSIDDTSFEVSVHQAYPNCPKYIQRRAMEFSTTPRPTRDPIFSDRLEEHHQKIIANADTLFVATMHPHAGLDVSHRGGKPGFVTIESNSRLRIPDYVGNGMFNTLGNIHETGSAGVMFIDFLGGTCLQVLGNASIDWNKSSEQIERTWTLEITKVRESAHPIKVQWQFIEASPLNPL